MTSLPIPEDDRAKSDDDLEKLRALIKRVFGRPDFIPETFFANIVDYLAVNQPPIPISQIMGFLQFTPQRDVVATVETTTSATYADLATTGPQLNELPNGTYLILCVGYMKTSAAASGVLMAPAVNGDTPTDDTAAITSNANLATHIGVRLASLTAGANTIVAKYRTVGGATGTFQYRNLVAIRIANS